jgi:hypothetical protein
LLELSASSAWAEYRYDPVVGVGDIPVWPAVRRDSPTCADLGATGDDVAAGAGAGVGVGVGVGADDDTDDSAGSPGHDGVTTQSMNCHTAATSVMSSSIVTIACASTRKRYPDGDCGEPSPAATILNVALPIKTASFSTQRRQPLQRLLDRCSEQIPNRMGRSWGASFSATSTTATCSLRRRFDVVGGA